MSLTYVLLALVQTTPIVDVEVPVCLSRSVTDAKGKRATFEVAVTSVLSSDLLKGGFTVMPCASSRWNAARYRAEMCKLAEGNSAVQARWAEMLGVEPKRLCEASGKLGIALDRALVATTN